MFHLWFLFEIIFFFKISFDCRMLNDTNMIVNKAKQNDQICFLFFSNFTQNLFKLMQSKRSAVDKNLSFKKYRSS